MDLHKYQISQTLHVWIIHIAFATSNALTVGNDTGGIGANLFYAVVRNWRPTFEP